MYRLHAELKDSTLAPAFAHIARKSQARIISRRIARNTQPDSDIARIVINDCEDLTVSVFEAVTGRDVTPQAGSC